MQLMSSAPAPASSFQQWISEDHSSIYASSSSEVRSGIQHNASATAIAASDNFFSVTDVDRECLSHTRLAVDHLRLIAIDKGEGELSIRCNSRRVGTKHECCKLRMKQETHKPLQLMSPFQLLSRRP